MTKGKRTPSEDFELGYQAGWAGHAKDQAKTKEIAADKLDAEVRLLRARLDEATKAREAAEKALMLAEKKLARATKAKTTA
jgi:hypothetical protein